MNIFSTQSNEHECEICPVCISGEYMRPLRILLLHLLTDWICFKCIAKKMIKQGSGGAIVNISSQAAQKALKDHTAYCTGE